ncbi:hypothetical protein NG819_16180 [Pseudarthrobacter sp. Fe7]|nr:hypothetical protein NG819_16180 [Pseudarthrobacter sp. Fe7]
MAEAEVAFGDPSVYIERYLTDIRHIEIQVISDGRTVLHLGERDCTAQRRNQKLIEESPSPVLDAELRQGLADAAVALCKEVGYKNAGTVEFVFDNIERTYYFIEMNTRIQVEHPVSEMVSGIDLIKLQLQIAGGMLLNLTQDDIVITGHAIECRINAEDPENNFAPGPGKITNFRAPGGFGIRMDTHIETGYTIPPYYDSMIGKLICWGKDRDEAIARTRRALDELVIDGIITTAPFHKKILETEKFVSGDFNTAFVAQFLETELSGEPRTAPNLNWRIPRTVTGAADCSPGSTRQPRRAAQLSRLGCLWEPELRCTHYESSPSKVSLTLSMTWITTSYRPIDRYHDF